MNIWPVRPHAFQPQQENHIECVYCVFTKDSIAHYPSPACPPHVCGRILYLGLTHQKVCEDCRLSPDDPIHIKPKPRMMRSPIILGDSGIHEEEASCVHAQCVPVKEEKTRQWVVEFRTSPEMEWAPNEAVDRTATVIRAVKPITRAQLMAAGERSSSEVNWASIADRWIALLRELGIEVEG